MKAFFHSMATFFQMFVIILRPRRIDQSTIHRDNPLPFFWIPRSSRGITEAKNLALRLKDPCLLIASTLISIRFLRKAGFRPPLCKIYGAGGSGISIIKLAVVTASFAVSITVIVTVVSAVISVLIVAEKALCDVGVVTVSGGSIVTLE